MIEAFPLTKPIRGVYQRYERWIPPVFFVLGFLFDAYMLRRIDEPFTLGQQGAYLLVSASLLGLTLLERYDAFRAPRLLAWPWKYRMALVHFLMGTLLNGYAIFYFKSASLFTSFAYLLFLGAVLFANEFWHVSEKRQIVVRMALLSLCTVSYFIYLVPIFLGKVGTLPFLISLVLSTLALGLAFLLLCWRLGRGHPALERELLAPFLGVHALVGLLYFAHAIPPVPLSVRSLGIYHDVHRSGGHYVLGSLEHSNWFSWLLGDSGDQTFLARPGDAIYCFARIVSPASFQDELQVRWLYSGPRTGWRASDAIPLKVTGGRHEGWRAVTVKKNYAPGKWRVQIETSDGRELGRLYFEVIQDESTGPRAMQIAVQ